ncbi:MAG: DNA mismatch repair protein MutS [Chitinophagaceae bacterium]|nr:MAG: DNA mismatch repair protein MutS [Chitinophagaceae bacterium]
MELDNITYNDLSLFQSEEEFSVFHKLNFTRTVDGKEWLSKFFKNPFNDLKKIRETQEILRAIYRDLDHWPTGISNGTVMVIAKFYDSNIDSIPGAGITDAVTYKIFHGPDFSLVRFSVTHFADFFRGFRKLLDLLQKDDIPLMLKSYLARALELINKPLLIELAERDPLQKLTWKETVKYGGFLKDHYKNQTFELISIYGRLDAWYSMAMAMRVHKLHFPDFIDAKEPLIDAKGLFHILLPQAIPYDVELSKETNFLFLTGANMAGKSTFIKAVGTTVFLAHLGMGVPAASMKLTMFDGLLSNINVVDNIVKGESYFFNEVQRIRKTILKIKDKGKWLVLIDELFKGTNVQDAMKCSSTVIKGLIKIQSSIFILSTHLYEIGEELKDYSNISKQYFETEVREDQLYFSYQLKNGVSNDRLGYLILKREKVVDLLESI